MSTHVIEVEGLTKRYMLGEGAYSYTTLREALSSLVKSRRRKSRPGRDVWALRDVSFTVNKGEPIGVIGRNGAGKTTLLKILARITEPTSGVARTKGRVGALLEVGTGFHPELTGRENIYLNGAVLGMSRRDIRRRFDEIVEFSGVERFLDTPLKRYSSGMSLRLAFAVAAHLEPEIVVVDEVLAVGDTEFQRRCLGKMSGLKGEGRTVVFVSHDLGAVTQLCERAIWLDNGVIKGDGPAHQVIDQYLRSTVEAQRADFVLEPNKPVQLISMAVSDESGASNEPPRRDEPFSLEIGFLTLQALPGLDISVQLQNRQGVPVLDELLSDRCNVLDGTDEPSEHKARITIPPVLPAGEYIVSLWIGRMTGPDQWETFVEGEPLSFQIRSLPTDRRDSVQRSRLVQPPVEWRVSSRSVRGSILR